MAQSVIPPEYMITYLSPEKKIVVVDRFRFGEEKVGFTKLAQRLKDNEKKHPGKQLSLWAKWKI